MKLKFFEDPGHGWLQVPRSLFEIFPDKEKISKYSYHDFEKQYFYLEEDCDADLFIEWLKKADIKYSLENIYQEVTPIRKMERIK